MLRSKMKNELSNRKVFEAFYSRAFRTLVLGLATCCFAVACGQPKNNKDKPNTAAPAEDKPAAEGKDQAQKPFAILGSMTADPSKATIDSATVSSDGLTEIVAALVKPVDPNSPALIKVINSICNVGVTPLPSQTDSQKSVEVRILMTKDQSDCKEASAQTAKSCYKITGSMDSTSKDRKANLSNVADCSRDEKQDSISPSGESPAPATVPALTAEVKCYDSDSVSCDAAGIVLNIPRGTSQDMDRVGLVVRTYHKVAVTSKMDASKVAKASAATTLVDKEMKSLSNTDSSQASKQMTFVRTVEIVNGKTFLSLGIGTVDQQLLILRGLLRSQSDTTTTSAILKVIEPKSLNSQLFSSWLMAQNLDDKNNLPKSDLAAAVKTGWTSVEGQNKKESLLLQMQMPADPSDNKPQVLEYNVALTPIEIQMPEKDSTSGSNNEGAKDKSSSVKDASSKQAAQKPQDSGTVQSSVNQPAAVSSDQASSDSKSQVQQQPPPAKRKAKHSAKKTK